MPMMIIEDTALEWPEAEAAFIDKDILSADEYYALEEQYRGLAFTSSRISAMSTMKRLKDRLETTIANGETLRQFRGWVESEKLGWAKQYSELVFRMAVFGAYSAGRYQQMNDPDLGDEFPLLMYDAIDDLRTRPTHAALDNTIWKRADFPEELWTPNGYNCRCEIRAISEDMARDIGGIPTTDVPYLPDGRRAWPDPGFRSNQSLPIMQGISLATHLAQLTAAVAAPSTATGPSPVPLAERRYVAREANELLDEATHWEGTLTAAELKAVQEYTSGQSMSMNGILRGKTGFIDDAAQVAHDRPFIDGLSSAIDKAGQLGKDSIFYRGAIRHHVFPDGLPPIGSQFVDNGFMSTSANPGMMGRFASKESGVIMRVHAPKESLGAYVDGISFKGGEREMIFQKGQTFEVTKIADEDGWTVLDILLLPGEGFERTGGRSEALVKKRGPVYRDDDTKFVYTEGDLQRIR